MNVIPLFGPMIGAARWPDFNILSRGGLFGSRGGYDCPQYTGLVYGVEAALALGQWAGAALITAGFVFRETIRVPVPVRVLPGASNTSAGLTLVGSF